MSERVCAGCHRSIDTAARTCPFCGGDPRAREIVDSKAIPPETVRGGEVSTAQSIVEHARRRQGFVLTIAVLAAIVVFGAIHRFVTIRNATAVTDAPPVPLSELTDLRTKPPDTTPVPMPPLDYQYDGRPQAMRTYIVEPGAVTPPEVLGQQIEQQKTSTQKGASAPAAGASPAGKEPR